MNPRTIGVALLLVCAGASAGKVDPALPPGSGADGRTPEQLSIAWWQWAIASPPEINPVRDMTGRHCAVGQDGNVWFLAGGFGTSKIRRSCTIPYGKYLFFPVVNMVYWPRKPNNGYTCEQAQQSAALNNDNALELFVEIDGAAPAEDPRQYRVRTKECFDIYGHIPRKLSPYRAYPSASDGYWLLLHPMPKGKHSLKFGGRYNAPGQPNGRMVQDIEYDLLVE